MTKDQKFKKEYARELLEIAEGDLETTLALLNAKKGRKENVCFSAQQVVEKSVKAVLCHLEIAVPFTHNLDILLDRLPEAYDLPGADAYNDLTEYATVRRYEHGTFELDQKDLEAAVNIAKKVISWAQKIIQ